VSSGRRSLHVAAALRPRARGKVRPQRVFDTRRLGPGPLTMTTERSRRLQTGHPRRLPDGRFSRGWLIPGRLGELAWPLPEGSYDDQVEADASLAAPPVPGSSARLGLGQRTRRSRIPRATAPTPAVLPCGCRRTAAGEGLPGSVQRTRNALTLDVYAGRPDAHAGHWTPVAWTSHTWTCPLTPDTGHRRSGRWPRTGQGDEGTAGTGHPGHHPSGRPLDA
jgi:hypothetical protein